MWHVVAQPQPQAEEVSRPGRSGDAVNREEESGPAQQPAAGQGDTVSADDNFLTARFSSLEAWSAELPEAWLETGANDRSSGSQPAPGEQGEVAQSAASGAAPVPVPVPSSAPLSLANGSFGAVTSLPSKPSTRAALGNLVEREPEGPGSWDASPERDRKIRFAGFTLNSAEGLRDEHQARLPETQLPETQLPESQVAAMLAAPIPKATPGEFSQLGPAANQSPQAAPADQPLGDPGDDPRSLAGINIGKGGLARAGATQDPVSFTLRLEQERLPMASSASEPPGLGQPENALHTAGGPITLPRESASERGESTEAFGTGHGIVRAESAGTSGSPLGGQTEGGDPQRSPSGREDGELQNMGQSPDGAGDPSFGLPGQSASSGSPLLSQSGSLGKGATVELPQVARPTPETAPERLTAAPRELVLTIPATSDGEGVLASVHVRDQNGAVEIAVRTPDAQLSSSLQESLPELVARLEANGTNASATHGDPAGDPSNGGASDWLGAQDRQARDGPQPRDGHQSRDEQPRDEQNSQGRGGGRDERQQHPEDRGQPRGQPGELTGELRKERQARWQASLGLASR